MPTVFIDLLIKAGRAALVEKIFNAPAYRQADNIQHAILKACNLNIDC